MPGEFEPHKGVYILWPQRPDNWRNGGKPAQKTFVKVAEAISEFEHVTVGVNDDQYANARTMLPDNVEVVEISMMILGFVTVALLLLRTTRVTCARLTGPLTHGAA